MTNLERLKATHTGELSIGDISIPCHVLEDGSRVISGRGMQNSLGFSRSASGLALTQLVDNKLKQFLSAAVIEQLKKPMIFDRVGGGGSAPETYGFDATILIDLSDALIEARKIEGFLNKTQKTYAEFAEVIIRSVAKVGIIALIDEATGYQEARGKDALQEYLNKILSKELAAWAKKFPDEFYENIYKLRGWQWQGMTVNRYSVVAHYTNDLVYERMAPGLLKELQERSPKKNTGERPNKLHQWLNTDIGNPMLAQHLHTIINFQRLAIVNGYSWEKFIKTIDQVMPKKGTTLELVLPDTNP